MPESIQIDLLNAARGNPIRAAEIARGVNAEWWLRLQEYKRAQRMAKKLSEMDNG